MPYLGKQPASVPVTADDIPNDSITTAKIVDAAITIDDIGPNAVGNSEMADDAVGLNELSATGTTNTSTFLRGDNSWAVPPDNNTVYTHPNHSGEVTSTADGAQVIADNVVDEANLKVSNSPTNGYFLSAQSGNTGGLTWAAVSASDATKLPLAGGTMTGNIVMADDTSIGIGDSAERIEFDGAGDICFLGCNVGIGTTTVASPENNSEPILQIGDGSNAMSSIVLYEDGNKWEVVSNNDLIIQDESVVRLRIAQAGDITFSDTSQAAKVTIKNDGKVGIGTGSPTSKLHIVDNSNYSLSVTKSGENIHMAQFASDGTAALGIAVDDNNNLVRLNSEGSNDSLQLEVDDGTVGVKIDSTGAVTMPNQPAFSVGMASHQSAIALYGERKAEFDSERFDQNADFNTTTHEFTAPVTGRYQLSFVCYLEPMQGDANFYGFHINTSNKSHFYYDLGRGDNHDHSGGGAMSVLADMDAGDTAFCAVYQHAGAANTKIMNLSTFSGFLAC